MNLIGAVINQAIKDLRISKERIGTNSQEKGTLSYYKRTAREFIFGKRKLEEFLHTFGVEEYINAGFIRKFAEDPKRFEELFKRMEIDNWYEKKSQYDEDKKYIKKRSVQRETFSSKVHIKLRNNGSNPPSFQGAVQIEGQPKEGNE